MAVTVAYRETLLLTARSGTQRARSSPLFDLTAPGVGVEIKESGG